MPQTLLWPNEPRNSLIYFHTERYRFRLTFTIWVCVNISKLHAIQTAWFWIIDILINFFVNFKFNSVLIDINFSRVFHIFRFKIIIMNCFMWVYYKTFWIITHIYIYFLIYFPRFSVYHFLQFSVLFAQHISCIYHSIY